MTINVATTSQSMNFITRIKQSLTKRKTLASMAEEQLLDEQVKLLEAQAGLEFAQAKVDQHSTTISRLRRTLEQRTLTERGELVS